MNGAKERNVRGRFLLEEDAYTPIDFQFSRASTAQILKYQCERTQLLFASLPELPDVGVCVAEFRKSPTPSFNVKCLNPASQNQQKAFSLSSPLV